MSYYNQEPGGVTHVSSPNAPMPNTTEKEDIVGKLSDAFGRAISNMAEATQLARDVRGTMTTALSELRKEMDQFKVDLEEARKRNAELDSLLSDVRRQRDDALRTVDEQSIKVRDLTYEVQMLSNQAEHDKRELNSLTHERDTARKERDDAEFKCMELQEQLDKANNQLEDIRSYASKMFGLQPPVTTPQVAVPTPAPEGASLASVLPASEPPKRRVYQGEEGFDWNNSNYDAVRGMYYTEV